jgi:uncharacterized RDD family membrane protein YckC
MGAAQSRPLLAGRGERLVAKIIDTVIYIFGVIMVVIFFLIDGVLGTLALLSLLAIPIIQVVLLSKDGQTIGKKALNIRIVMVNSGQNGGFGPNVALRAWLTTLLGIIPFFGLVDVLFIFREDQRCIHDLIAGTHVIE